MKLKEDSVKAIRLSLNLDQVSEDGYLYDINTRAQSEQFVKVAFRDYYAFSLIADLKLVSLLHKFLKIDEIPISEVLKFLRTNDTIELSRKLEKKSIIKD
jgi:hypothetical protein